MITLIIIGILLLIINYILYGMFHPAILYGAFSKLDTLIINIFHKIMLILSFGCIGYGIYKFFN